ncbi:uncharacterized protein LOC124496183 isoform X2 [Dermatophagoides farinae]|uniref:uncharacterized protein LOC124496183 isoform X2 n=1 Tax=Dermatophagoides farinae TaxID=6954 RepID=UPI003F648590
MDITIKNNRNNNNNSPEPEDSGQDDTAETIIKTETATATSAAATSSTLSSIVATAANNNRQRSNSAIALSLLKSAASFSSRSGIGSINNNNNNNSTTITSSSSIVAPVDLRIAANNLLVEAATTFSLCSSSSSSSNTTTTTTTTTATSTTTTTTTNHHHHHHNNHNHHHHSHHNNNNNNHHLLTMSTTSNNNSIVQPQQQQQQQQQQQHQQTSSTSMPAVFASSLTTSGFINSSFGPTNPLAAVSANQILVTNSRKQREFIPDSKKDESYWDRRKRNNEAAKRSREKRRISDLVLETRVLELTRENSILKAELYAIKEKFGISQNQHFIDPDSVTIPLPENATKIRRSRIFSSILGGTSVNRSDYTSNNHHQGSNNISSQSANTVSTSSFNYSCSLSPNSQSSSSSEVHVSTSPTYHGATANSSPPNVCPLLTGQPTNCLAGLATPISVLTGNKTTLPFKLRHKAQGNCSSNNVNSVVAQIRNQETSNIGTHNDSDASSDSSSVAQLSSSAESTGIFGDHHRDSAGSPDSLLKTENYALKSELQRLASEVATLKNVLVLNQSINAVTSGPVIGGHASNFNKSNNERCNRFHQTVSPMETHSPIHYNEDLDSKDLLKNVIQFQKLNDIIV